MLETTEPPKEPTDPEPGEPETEDPGDENGKDSDDGTTPGIEDDDKDKDKDQDGEKLPKTATVMYNYLLLGFILLALGTGLLVFLYRNKQQQIK